MSDNTIQKIFYLMSAHENRKIRIGSNEKWSDLLIKIQTKFGVKKCICRQETNTGPEIKTDSDWEAFFLGNESPRKIYVGFQLLESSNLEIGHPT